MMEDPTLREHSTVLPALVTLLNGVLFFPSRSPFPRSRRQRLFALFRERRSSAPAPHSQPRSRFLLLPLPERQEMAENRIGSAHYARTSLLLRKAGSREEAFQGVNRLSWNFYVTSAILTSSVF